MKRINLIVLALCGLAVLPSRLLAAGDPPLRPSAKADKVVVLKSERKLLLMKGAEVLKTYRISLGGSPVGPKIRQGDQKTPEGQYVLDRRNAKSQFHKSIHISYPNAADLARAQRLGVSPGGNLFIHGLPNRVRWVAAGHRVRDWTDGCIAVTNAEMDEIWRAVADGTAIEIKP